MSLWPGVGHSKANVILTRTSMSDDLLWGLVWAAVTAMIVRLGWAAATRLFPGDGYIDLIQHTIVIVIAQITVATIIIGGLGYLSPGSLLEAGTIVAVVTRVAVGRLHLPTTRTRDECDRGWLAIWLLVFAGCAGYTVIRGLLCFPADWDTLMYHLPLVDHWLQAGSLYAPDALRWSMPGNNEIVILWMVAPFSGDFLSVLGNIPAVILLACSARALGGLTGASVTWRNLGALAVVTNSVVSNQLVDAENDVAVAAMFLAGLTYGLRYASEGRLGDLLLGAVSLGLLGGVKFYALGYLAVAAGVLVVVIAVRRSGRAALGATAAGIIGTLVLAGYWYARNWVHGGAPLHPLGATAAGPDLANQYPDLWGTTFLGNGRPEVFSLSIAAVWARTGPCHLVALLSLPVTLGWLLLRMAIGHRTESGHTATAQVALAAATVGAGLVLLVTPMAVEDVPGTLNQLYGQYCPVRYGTCFLSLAILVLTLTLNSISRAVTGRALESLTRITLCVAFATGIAVQFWRITSNRSIDQLVDCLLTGGVVLLLIAIGAMLWRCFPQYQAWIARAGVALGVAGVGASVGPLAARWHDGYTPYYDKVIAHGLFDYMSRKLPPKSVICVLDYRPYPFFGSARQFHVSQRATPSDSTLWIDDLRARQVVLVITQYKVDYSWRSWHEVHGWLRDNPGIFSLLNHPYWWHTVYKVDTPPSGVSTLSQ